MYLARDAQLDAIPKMSSLFLGVYRKGYLVKMWWNFLTAAWFTATTVEIGVRFIPIPPQSG